MRPQRRSHRRAAAGDQSVAGRVSLDELLNSIPPQAPLDTAVPVAASDMDGANIWMLNQLAQEGNFSINFFLYKLPPALVGAPDATAVLSYLLGTKGYDCITTGVQVTAARGTVASFLTPTEAYGYVAVYGFNFDAFIVAIIKDDIAAYAKLFFFWVVPFSTNVWRLLFVSLTVVGIVMCILERRHNEVRLPPLRRPTQSSPPSPCIAVRSAMTVCSS